MEGCCVLVTGVFFFFKQKTAYEMRISDWSSDVCSSDLYVVFGKRYTPVSDEQPFRQEGTASWYGRKFHGKKTANGETYDMYAMSAAHPTLPIPSYARITRAGTGKSVIVRINDRGPFHSSRIIDLSYRSEEHTSELQSLMRISYADFCLKK